MLLVAPIPRNLAMEGLFTTIGRPKMEASIVGH